MLYIVGLMILNENKLRRFPEIEKIVGTKKKKYFALEFIILEPFASFSLRLLYFAEYANFCISITGKIKNFPMNNR